MVSGLGKGRMTVWALFFLITGAENSLKEPKGARKRYIKSKKELKRVRKSFKE